MGHCVGGYCDDVAEGRSNIYSLRDAKGQPHVTIETGPARVYEDMLDEAHDEAGAADIPFGTLEYDEFIDTTMAYLKQKAIKDSGLAIVQIKGKGNAKPAAQYLPFVQDFVRSGQWGDISDAMNTGLTPNEIQQILKGSK